MVALVAPASSVYCVSCVTIVPTAGNVPHTPPFNPSGGGHNATGSGQHQHAGVYVDGGRGGEHPCWWLKRKYDQTSNHDWINRYRQCLSWHRTD